MEYVVVSLLLTIGLLFWDLVPLLKNKTREKKAVWFAIPVYAAALVLNILIGFGVPIALGQALTDFLGSFIKIG